MYNFYYQSLTVVSKENTLAYIHVRVLDIENSSLSLKHFVYLDPNLFHSLMHGISVLFSVNENFESRHLRLTLSLRTRPADVSDQLTCVVLHCRKAVLQNFLYPGQCVCSLYHPSVLLCSQWI